MVIFKGEGHSESLPGMLDTKYTPTAEVALKEPAFRQILPTSPVL